jgi:hypothetical protein
MNLDSIITFLLNGFCLSDEYREGLNIHINKKFVKHNNSSVLKIIIPQWGDEEFFATRILIRRLHKEGYSCLYFCLPKDILSSNVKDTIKFFNSITEQIKRDIQKLKDEYNFQRIDIIAASLGCVSACLIANGNKDIQNLFLLVPGSCLAQSLWNGIRTQKLRNIYEQQNINQEQLKNIWKDLAPKNNINLMNDKNIFIAISKSDKLISYSFGKELADLVKKLYPKDTTIKENNYLGHYLTVAKYYLFDKALLK